MLGIRLMPSLSVGVLDFAAGIAIWVADVYFDLSAMGIWGRNSVSAGNIVTTGGGIRGAVFWRGMNRPHTSLGIGPAVEVLGVFGYGRGNDGVTSHQGGRPVVNVLLSAGGAFTLTPKTAMNIVIGAGYSALYFEMRRDGDTVSGFSGASVNVGIGVSFGVPSRGKD
jgi:hypothetical protein